MQNILTGWDSITQRGLYEVPYSMEARSSIVDLNDIAEVAVKVLTESSHSGAIYEFAGPQPLSQIEVAEILSKKLGCAVKTKLIEIGVWQKNAERAGLGPYQIETLKKMFQYYDKFGFQGNPNVLQKLLGRSPTTFEEFIDRIINNQGE
jgi:nucleoside-diphosphate-sugar epimerase